MADIQRLTGRSMGAIRRVLRKDQIEPGPQSTRTQPIDVNPDEVARLYEEEHMSVRGIAAHFGISYGKAHKVVSETCSMRPPGGHIEQVSEHRASLAEAADNDADPQLDHGGGAAIEPGGRAVS